jgi:protein phosphatase
MTSEAQSRTIADGSVGVEVAGVTDRGTVRTENQDIWAAFVAREETPNRVGIVVGDGMGGHAGGREAAAAAVEAAVLRMREGGTQPDLVRDAIHDANAAVAGVRHVIGGDPGTTLVLASVTGDQAVIGNVGDSRAYLIRGGLITQLTFDHSWVGDEVRAGRLQPEEVRRHPRRNVITRAVMGVPVVADVLSAYLQPGDTLLLCSDGVWEPLSDEHIAELVTDGGPLVRDLERLCEAALDAGGQDNVTAVAARLTA